MVERIGEEAVAARVHQAAVIVLADLLRDEDTELTRLPWVNRRQRRWEPEPFRWLGVNLGLRVMGSADAVEARTGRPAKRADILAPLLGGH